MRLTPILVLGILGLLGWFFLRFPLEAKRAGLRNLDNFRILALPQELPSAWRQELLLALEGAPQVSLLSPTALLAARNVFAGLTWLDPTSLQVEATLPLGLEVRFRMRRPVLQIQRRHEGQLSWSLVTANGTVLPVGHPMASSPSLPRLISPVPLPVAGRVASDPLVQQALALLPEFASLAQITGLNLVALERMPGYPPEAANVPPAMAFVLADGTRIFWGRADVEQDPGDSGMASKVSRLQALLQEHPGLQGLRAVRLHGALP